MPTRHDSQVENQISRRGWRLGKETYRHELLTQMRRWMGAEHYSTERLETATARTERIIAEELNKKDGQKAFALPIACSASAAVHPGCCLGANSAIL